MTKNVLVTTSTRTALDAARLMRDAGCGSIVIEDDGRPVGILTERDFLRKIMAEDTTPSRTYVKDVMSKPLITIDPNASIKNAAELMIERKIRRLPVVKDNYLIGIIVASDFAKNLSKKSITKQIMDAIARYPPAKVPVETEKSITKNRLKTIVGETGLVVSDYGGFAITINDPASFPWRNVISLLAESFEVWMEKKGENLIVMSKPKLE